MSIPNEWNVPTTINPENVPETLTSLRQWSPWRYVLRDGQQTKLPNIASDRPDLWLTFDEALRQYHDDSRFEGVGFMLSADDGFVGVDFDDCRDVETGELDEEVEFWVEALNTYCEVSPSGTGLKLWVRANKTWTRCRRGKVETYSEGRFFTVTGSRIEGCSPRVESRQAEVEALARTLLGPDESTQPIEEPESPPWRTAEEVIDRLCESPVAKALWEGDLTSVGDDHSAGDFALCKEIAECCGGAYIDLIDDVFRESNLMRSKWDSPRGESTYGRETIERALRDPELSFESPTEELIKLFPKEATPLNCPIITLGGLPAEPTHPGPVLIEGLLREREVAVVVAGSKSNKSWTMLDVAMSLATGRPLLGQYPTRRCAVLILDNELKANVMQSRMQTVAAHRQVRLDDHAGLEAHILRGQGVRIGSAKFEAHLKDFCRKYGDQAKVVICDAFYRMSPAKSEVDNAEVTAVFDKLDAYCEKYGLAMIIVHHTSKGDQSKKNVIDVGSGAGALARCPDTYLTLRPHADSTDEEPMVVVDARCRSFPPFKRQTLRWAFPVWEPSNVEPRLENAKEKERQERDAETEAKILKAMSSGKVMGFSELEAFTDYSKTVVKRNVESLVSSGDLVELERGEHGCRQFQLANVAELHAASEFDDGDEPEQDAEAVVPSPEEPEGDEPDVAKVNLADELMGVLQRAEQPLTWREIWKASRTIKARRDIAEVVLNELVDEGKVDKQTTTQTAKYTPRIVVRQVGTLDLGGDKGGDS